MKRKGGDLKKQQEKKTKSTEVKGSKKRKREENTALGSGQSSHEIKKKKVEKPVSSSKEKKEGKSAGGRNTGNRGRDKRSREGTSGKSKVGQGNNQSSVEESGSSSTSEFVYNSPAKKSKNQPKKEQNVQDAQEKSKVEIPLETNKRRGGIEGTQDSILEKLSRLFEKREQGCAAICFVNNKILITDNEIFQGTREGKKETERTKVNTSEEEEKASKSIGKYQLIKNTMDYFSKTLSDEKLSSEERNKAFQDICMHRISSQGKVPGMEYIRPNEGKFIKLVQDAFEEYEKLRGEGEGRGRKRDDIREQIVNTISKKSKDIDRDIISFVCKHVVGLAWDFMKIEEFLSNDKNKDNPLKQAFGHGAIKDSKKDMINVQTDKDNYGLNRDGYMLMQEYSKETGYVILKIDIPTKPGKGKKSPHAEVKMIEYLLFTGILNGKEDVYIGISKKCCYDCELTIMAVNNVLKKKGGGQILYKGTHGMEFKYTPPFFLSELKIKEHVCYRLWGEGTRIKKKKGTKESIEVTPSNVQNLELSQNEKVYITLDPEVVELIREERSRLEQEYKPRDKKAIFVNMADRSYSTSVDETEEIKKDAYSQRNNSKYLYTEEDLNKIGKKLVEDAKGKAEFVGALNKGNIPKHKALQNGEKVLGIYEAGNNKFIAFCVERKGDNIKLYYADHSMNADVRELAEAFNAQSATNRVGISNLVSDGKNTDSAIIALCDLREFALNSKKSYQPDKEIDKYQKNIDSLRQEFADVYAQEAFGVSKGDMEAVKKWWAGYDEEFKGKFKKNIENALLAEDMEQRISFIETYLSNVEEACDILMEGEEEKKLKPGVLELLKGVMGIEEGEQRKSGRDRSSAQKGQTLGKVLFEDPNNPTPGEIVTAYQDMFGDIKPSEALLQVGTSQPGRSTIGSFKRAYKEGPEYNAFNEYWDQQYQYQNEDMTNIGNQIAGELEEQGVAINFIGVLGTTKEAGSTGARAALQSYKEIAEKRGTGVGVYNTGGRHWIAFSLIPGDKPKTITLLYKDSLGSKREDLERDVKAAFPEEDGWVVNIKYDSKGMEQKETPMVSCGLFALQNMEVMAREIAKDKEKFIDKFEEVSFYNPIKGEKNYAKVIKDLREEFAAKCAKGIYENSLVELKEFKQRMRRNEDLTKEKAAEIKFIDDKIGEVVENLEQFLLKNVEVAHNAQEEEKKFGEGHRFVVKLRYEPEQEQGQQKQKDSSIKDLLLTALELGEGGYATEESNGKDQDGKVYREMVLTITDQKMEEKNIQKGFGTLSTSAKMGENKEPSKEEISQHFIGALNIKRLPSQSVSNRIEEKLEIKIPSHEDIERKIKMMLEASTEANPITKEEILANLREEISFYFKGADGKNEETNFTKYITSLIQESIQEVRKDLDELQELERQGTEISGAEKEKGQGKQAEKSAATKQQGTKKQDNEATKRFLEKDDKNLTQLDYESWYTPDTVGDLFGRISNSKVLECAFDDSEESEKQVETSSKQLNALIGLVSNVSEAMMGKVSASCFILKEPGILGVSHFMVGMLVKDPSSNKYKLLLINPIGESDHIDFYKAVNKLISDSGVDIEVYMSNDKIQIDKGGEVSCGPISVELGRYISGFSPEELYGKLDALSEEALVKKEGLTYHNVSVKEVFLPETLKALMQKQNQEEVKKAMEEIRQSHLSYLQGFSEEELGKSGLVKNAVLKDDSESRGKVISAIAGERIAAAERDKQGLIERNFITHAKENEIDKIKEALKSKRISEVIAKNAVMDTSSLLVLQAIREAFPKDRFSYLNDRIDAKQRILKREPEVGLEQGVEGKGGEELVGGWSEEERNEAEGEHLKRVEKSGLVRSQGIESVDSKAQYNLHEHLKEINIGRKDFAQELDNLDRRAKKQREEDFAQSNKRLYTQLVTGNKGTVTILSESNHMVDHNKNISSLIENIESGKIPPNTVIALERKQYGTNLGMKDVIELANIISHNEKYPTNKIAIPKEIENSLIYQDAKLYKAAQERDITVIGIEGKGLDANKDSQEYNLKREEYMVEVLSQITRAGYNVCLSVGESHVESLKVRLKGEEVRSKVIGDAVDEVQSESTNSKFTEKVESVKAMPDKEPGRQ
jgi:hypothetical protein